MRNFGKYAFLLVLITICVVQASAKDPRKKRPATFSAGNSVIIEPDHLSLKSKAENIVAPQVLSPLGAPQGHGKINNKYKEGIDVSHYQYNIDWTRLAREENISYVYIKATEGESLVDDYYRKNLEGARKAGISVGSYHFYRPNVSWNVQLENMKHVVKASEQDLVPLIDIEKFSGSESAFIENLTKFIEAVTKHYGKKPLLYTYQNFYNKHFQGLFANYQWMIACYGSVEPVLRDGRKYIMWQYSASGRVSGINGDVDRSRIMGNHSLKELQM